MISISTKMTTFFETATQLKAKDLLELIIELQHHISQLPGVTVKMEEDSKNIYLNGVLATSLGPLTIRGTISLIDNFFCVTFGHISLNYLEGSAYASDGGKRIALWTRTEFFLLK